MARNADATNLDPFLTGDDASIFVDLQIYDRLVKLGADGKSFEPELATAWESSSDGLSITFTLRPNVEFSDGTPVMADDVVSPRSVKPTPTRRGASYLARSPA